MENEGNILIVDDDEDILTAGRLLLRRSFGSVVTTRTPEKIPDLLKEQAFDALLLDMNFGPGESSGQQGLEWLERTVELDADLGIVMITAHGSVNAAVEAMKRGAVDFIIKPWQNEKVVATVSSAVKLTRSRRETESLRATNKVLTDPGAPTPIIGDSTTMRGVLSIVERAAPTDANVMILGENGTGKELIARELHRQSSRADQVFLSVDMGTITESLFESELFGHKKGAFTGADEDRPGKFQAANGGTVFLDEIGNLPLNQQAKLLRVLEERRVTPVGADKSEAINVRVVAATNAPAHVLRDREYFRPDLLFRLNTVEIVVPPLRDRKEDILPIARYYLERYARRYNKGELTFSTTSEEALKDYDWPGNVRALRHTVERAVILANGNEIEPADLQLDTPTALHVAAEPEHSLNLEDVEKQTISSALRKHGFNISRTAKELGLTRASLYRRMEKHGL